MFTHSYKSGYIHGSCNSSECTAQIGYKTIKCKSYRSAQLAITKELKNVY
jgi:hypothetical protein